MRKQREIDLVEIEPGTWAPEGTKPRVTPDFPLNSLYIIGIAALAFYYVVR